MTMSPREKVLLAICENKGRTSGDLADAILAALASSGDHAELARLAEAATPGPWEASGTVVWREEVVPIPVTVCCGNGLPSGECCGNGVEGCEWDRTQGEVANAGSHDAAFIAAANPATVLALIAEVAALRGAKWEAQHVDTMNDMVLMGMARDDAEARATEAERKLAEAVEWRPIETAPRDGDRFLAYGGGLDDQVETCSWSETTCCWNLETFTADDSDDEPEGYCRPTHWLPLPPAPGAEDE